MSNLIVKQNFNLNPTNFDEATKFAEIIAKSDVCPKNFKGKPGDVLVAMVMAMDLGLSVMQGLQNIAVINGQPSVWGETALALVKAHPKYLSHEELNFDEIQKESKAICILERKGEKKPYIATFSIDDAKKAGLWGKAGPWTNYPWRMLQMRARGFCIKTAFPDALKGLVLAEEAQDWPVAERVNDDPKNAEERLALKLESSKIDDLPGSQEIFNDLKSKIENVHTIEELKEISKHDLKNASSQLNAKHKEEITTIYKERGNLIKKAQEISNKFFDEKSETTT